MLSAPCAPNLSLGITVSVLAQPPWHYPLPASSSPLPSRYLDRYNVLHQESDLKTANAYKTLIPSAVLDEFTWRRARNMRVLQELLTLQRETHALHRIYSL